MDDARPIGLLQDRQNRHSPEEKRRSQAPWNKDLNDISIMNNKDKRNEKGFNNKQVNPPTPSKTWRKTLNKVPYAYRWKTTIIIEAEIKYNINGFHEHENNRL